MITQPHTPNTFTATNYTKTGTTERAISGNTEALREALTAVFDNGCAPERWELSASQDVPADIRAAITAIVADLAQSEHTHEKDSGSRVTFDVSHTEHFAWGDEWCGEKHAAFWVTPRHFVLVTLSGEFSAPTFSVSHWHPGSMCSGSWADVYGEIINGVSGKYLLNDDDGKYFALTAPAGDIATEAERLISFVRGVELFGAEQNLLALLVHGFPDDGIEDLRLEYLPRTENDGYEISAGISISAELLELLRNHPACQVDSDTAIEWLNLLTETTKGKSALNERLEECENEKEGWLRLIAYLQEVSRIEVTIDESESKIEPLTEYEIADLAKKIEDSADFTSDLSRAIFTILVVGYEYQQLYSTLQAYYSAASTACRVTAELTAEVVGISDVDKLQKLHKIADQQSLSIPARAEALLKADTEVPETEAAENKCSE